MFLSSIDKESSLMLIHAGLIVWIQRKFQVRSSVRSPPRSYLPIYS